MNNNLGDIGIPVLGEPKIPSPLAKRRHEFVSDSERIVIDVRFSYLQESLASGGLPPGFEMAGPRKHIYFDPSKLRCALVTCGGLCPGLNDIIRAIVLELYHTYGVRNIFGIRHGLQGFIPKYGHGIMELTPEIVSNILDMGGSILGSSRGPQPIDEIVDSLERMNVGLLFMIGGDGAIRAAIKIANHILERGLKIAVVGIPKTIDNDIHLVSRSFGFDTAVEVATQAIRAAHNEARGYPNGIGMIKLMGRHAGFIASTATLAQQNVNFTLIPEVDFDLEGHGGFLNALGKRLEQRNHAVIVVAEGAGQKFFEIGNEDYDLSGNIKLKDVGIFLKEKIHEWARKREMDVSLKYIDPSYMIRSLPANANDHVFCNYLGRDAVHAGMAGKTKMIVSYWNNYFVHVPMDAAAKKRKQVDPGGKLWLSVLNATGQGSLRKQ